MKNLENYGVQTLNAKEIREIDGGIDFWDVYLWMWSQAEAVGPQNPGAGGYMGSKM